MIDKLVPATRLRGIERVHWEKSQPIHGNKVQEAKPALPAESAKEPSLRQLFPDRSLEAAIAADLTFRLRDKRLLVPSVYNQAAAACLTELQALLARPEWAVAHPSLKQTVELLAHEVDQRDQLDAYLLALRQV